MALQLKVGCLFFPHWPHPVVFWTPSWLFAQGSSRWGLGTTKDAWGSNLGPPCARQAPWLLYSLAAGLCPKCWPFLSQPVLWRSTYASLDTFNLPQSFSKESTSLSFTSFLWDIREPIRSRQRSGLIPPLPEKSITSFQLPKNPGARGPLLPHQRISGAAWFLPQWGWQGFGSTAMWELAPVPLIEPHQKWWGCFLEAWTLRIHPELSCDSLFLVS